MGETQVTLRNLQALARFAVPTPMGNEAEKEECSVCFPQETHSWTTLQRAVSCGHTGNPDRRREALVGLDPTVPSLILGELMFNTTDENYPSLSQQQVCSGASLSALSCLQLGNAAPRVGHTLVHTSPLCVHPWATAGE